MKNIQLNVSHQRKFEGEVQLQSVGKKPAIKAQNLIVGLFLVCFRYSPDYIYYYIRLKHQLQHIF